MRGRIFRLVEPFLCRQGARLSRAYRLGILRADLLAQLTQFRLGQLTHLGRPFFELVETFGEIFFALRDVRERALSFVALFVCLAELASEELVLFLELVGVRLCLVPLLHERRNLAARHARQIVLFGELLALLLGHAEQRQDLRIREFGESVRRRLAGERNLPAAELPRNAHVVLRRAGLVAEPVRQISRPLALRHKLLCLLEPRADLYDSVQEHLPRVVADGVDFRGYDLDRPYRDHIFTHLHNLPSVHFRGLAQMIDICFHKFRRF